MNYYYIHGFASGKNSSTFGEIRKRIPAAKALAYDSAKTYSENMESLVSQIAGDKEPCCIIGSSLGGFYAMQLTPFAHYCAARLLVNPCVAPRSTLESFKGECPNFESGKTFPLTSDICNSYPADLDISILLPEIPTTVLLSKNDEILDYRIAEQKFRHCADIKYINGKHRLSDYFALFSALKRLTSVADFDSSTHILHFS